VQSKGVRTVKKAARRNRVVELRECIDAVLEQYRLSEGVLLIRIRDELPHIVGESISHHLEPVALKDRRLTLKVDSSEWRQVIHDSYLAQIREKLNDFAPGKVNVIYLC